MLKVMLVEDDNNLREIYEARLQAEGYTIVSAKDGEEALAVAKSEKPDLIISDIMMPKISGFEMLDIIRNTEGLKTVKVIMLTALGQNDDQQRATKLGADRYLVKSQVTLEDIVKASHELLADSAPQAASAALPTAQAAPAASAPSTMAEPPAPNPVDPPLPPPPPPEPRPEPQQPPTEPETPHSAPMSPPASPVSVDTINPVSSAVAAPSVTAASGSAVNTTPASSETATQALSTSDEKASVESEIENFVAGATTEPTPPTNSNLPPSPSSTSSDLNSTITSSGLASTDLNTASGASSSDDNLMNDAVNSLSDASDNTSTAPVIEEDKSSGSASPIIAPEASSDDTQTGDNIEIDTPNATSVNDNVTIAHKKVINPIDSKEKPDIQKLYAIEQAKEAVTDTSIPKAVVADSKGTKEEPLGSKISPPNINPATPTDPNSIAL